MAWEKKLQEKGNSLLERFDNYHQGLAAERAARREARRHRVFALDRTMALMIDFGIILLVFSSTIFDAANDGLAVAGILSQNAHDPSFTSDQVARAMAESGVLKSWIAVSLSQLTVLSVVVVPCLYYLQATPGMLLLGLRMRHADRITHPSFLRVLAFYFWGCILLAPCMVSFLGMFFRKDHRAWHDVLSGTAILRNRTIKYEREQAMLRAVAEADEASRGTAAE